MNVLLIEDNRLAAAALHKALGDAFPVCSVITAGTLNEGIKWATDKAFDAVLLDLILPDSMTPEETCRKFGSIMRQMPVIVCTAAEGEAAVYAVEHGAEDYIFKDSITPAYLRAKIEFAISRFKRRWDELAALRANVEQLREALEEI